MAKISFQLIGKKEQKKIYVRLTIDRKNQYQKNSGYSIETKDWSKKNSFVKTGGDEIRKKLHTDLLKLKSELQEKLNTSKGVEMNSNWLKNQIDLHNGVYEYNDVERLINLFDYYIKNNDDIGSASITKYKTIKKKIEAYEDHTQKKIYLKDVNLLFKNGFVSYLKDEEKLSNNTVSRYIKFVKTVAHYGKKLGYEVSPQLNDVTLKLKEIEYIYFTFDEIEQIQNTKIVSDALNNARDWLVIGCYIGQRVSDLLTLTKKNISSHNGIEIIELKQKKTGKEVVIPIHPKVKMILESRNGEFPYKIAAAKFNLHIKKVSKLAGINKPVQGATMQEIKINEQKTFRKKEGIFPKYELVTSHICRRSFASNYYGEMPTSLIIAITGHSTEEMFLKYVGKPPKDHAKEIAKYLNSIFKEQEKKQRLTIGKAI